MGRYKLSETSYFFSILLEIEVGALLKRTFSNCKVYGPSSNVYIASSNKIVHPDATVICGPENCPKPDCIDNPTIVAEVTSLSTQDYDYGTKRAHYFSLPSVQHYLLVSQTEKTVGHYERSGAGWTYIDRHSDAAFLLGNVEISVGDIYAGIL